MGEEIPRTPRDAAAQQGLVIFANQTWAPLLSRPRLAVEDCKRRSLSLSITTSSPGRRSSNFRLAAASDCPSRSVAPFRPINRRGSGRISGNAAKILTPASAIPAVEAGGPPIVVLPACRPLLTEPGDFVPATPVWARGLRFRSSGGDAERQHQRQFEQEHSVAVKTHRNPRGFSWPEFSLRTPNPHWKFPFSAGLEAATRRLALSGRW